MKLTSHLATSAYFLTATLGTAITSTLATQGLQVATSFIKHRFVKEGSPIDELYTDCIQGDPNSCGKTLAQNVPTLNPPKKEETGTKPEAQSSGLGLGNVTGLLKSGITPILSTLYGLTHVYSSCTSGNTLKCAQTLWQQSPTLMPLCSQLHRLALAFGLSTTTLVAIGVGLGSTYWAIKKLRPSKKTPQPPAKSSIEAQKTSSGLTIIMNQPVFYLSSDALAPLLSQGQNTFTPSLSFRKPQHTTPPRASQKEFKSRSLLK